MRRTQEETRGIASEAEAWLTIVGGRLVSIDLSWLPPDNPLDEELRKAPAFYLPDDATDRWVGLVLAGATEAEIGRSRVEADREHERLRRRAARRAAGRAVSTTRVAATPASPPRKCRSRGKRRQSAKRQGRRGGGEDPSGGPAPAAAPTGGSRPEAVAGSRDPAPLALRSSEDAAGEGELEAAERRLLDFLIDDALRAWQEGSC